MLALLIGCGLRRGELLALTVDSIQLREEHWVIADPHGKVGHIRTVPIPLWVTPQHAAVFFVDEKTAIQALDRLDPVLPLSPGRAERHGFEYYKHGTLSLYAALDVKTGKIQGKTAKRHTSSEFISFLSELVGRARWAKEIHIVLDNLSAHKTKAVQEFLAEHPKVRFHFTPTYSSWLNQVELWFAKLQRDLLARGIFTSVTDLSRKIGKYIRAYAKVARPFRWSYSDPSRRIIANPMTGTAY